MKPEPAKFTRENPCTKKHIWNCFASATGFTAVPVVEAQKQIGVNAPRVMERNARLTVVTRRGVDYYELTSEGKAWLRAGAEAYIRNHPSESGDFRYLRGEHETDEAGGAGRRIRRVTRRGSGV